MNKEHAFVLCENCYISIRGYDSFALSSANVCPSLRLAAAVLVHVHEREHVAVCLYDPLPLLRLIIAVVTLVVKLTLLYNARMLKYSILKYVCIV